MPNWTFLLVIAFVTLGLWTRPKWNANLVAVGITVLMLLYQAVRGHLIA